MTTQAPGRHQAPEEPNRPTNETFTEVLRDAIAPRVFFLVLGVGVLCLGFVLSYVGAFHSPKPHRVPIAVVAPQQVSTTVVSGLNGIGGQPLHATAVSERTATEQLRRLDTSAVLVVDPTGSQDRLLVATGGGAAMAATIERVVAAAEAKQRRTVTVTDAVPHQAGDTQGTSVFYVAIGSILAGYLLAAVLGMARGARPATFRRTLWRLGAAIPYSLFVGLGTAVITGPVLGALTGHFATVFGIAALLTFTAATVTMTFQILFGVMGIAATILVFVIIGNPSAGGAYPYRLLPPFWRTVGPWIPNGAGVDALRRAIYFESSDLAPRVWVIVAWAVIGTFLAAAAGRFRDRRATAA